MKLIHRFLAIRTLGVMRAPSALDQRPFSDGLQKRLEWFLRLHSFHIISYRFISFHIVSYHFIPFHVISYHSNSFHVSSCHFMAFLFISYHIISIHFISFQFISYQFMSVHVILCHFCSFHIISGSIHFISLIHVHWAAKARRLARGQLQQIFTQRTQISRFQLELDISEKTAQQLRKLTASC